MGTLGEISNGTGSVDYLTVIIIVLAVAIVAVVILLVYTLQRKKRTQEPPIEPYVPPVMTYQTPQQTPSVQDEQEPPQQQCSEKIPPSPEQYPGQPAESNGPSYPGSIVVVGNYTLFNDRIQISPRKCVFYDEITDVRYESNYDERVIIRIGHAWELSLSAGDQTLRLYNSMMNIMNSEMMVQHLKRKKHLLR